MIATCQQPYANFVKKIDIQFAATYNQLIIKYKKGRNNMAQGQISEKNTRISIVIPKDLKVEADKIANSDGRSLSGWIRKLIVDAISTNNKSNTTLQ